MNMKTLFAVCFLFLCAARVESRRHGGSERRYKLFVFGDSYADNGNLPMANLSMGSRAWYQPHGMSDADHDHKPTGRFSDGMVQSDFLAKILGRDESPPAERLRGRKGVDPFGMNFAVGWAGVYEVSHEVPRLGTQINHFRRLVNHGIIDKDLSDSVALVAISGFDYSDLPDEETDHAAFINFIKDVTQKIADSVRHIQDVGVTKVLVNMLHPMGCTPWETRPLNYTGCNTLGNMVTAVHNKELKDKLGQEDNVLLLDLNTIFTDIVSPRNGSTVSKKFLNELEPCCESIDGEGYCGQYNETGDAQFWLCSNPDEYFYWDAAHPTQAGWKAVMEMLEGTIKDFLNISW